MSYLDISHAMECEQKPRLPWARAHKWIGIGMFGLACFGAGTVNSTIYYKVTHLWHSVGSETAGKSERLSTTPDCIPVTPPVIPLPKPSP